MRRFWKNTNRYYRVVTEVTYSDKPEWNYVEYCGPYTMRSFADKVAEERRYALSFPEGPTITSRVEDSGEIQWTTVTEVQAK